jgi:hypothetical protein
MLGFEDRWAQATLEAYAPYGADGLSPTIGEVDYLGWFETMRVKAPFLAGLGLRLAIWLIALSPMWHLGRARLFASLPILDRAALLDRLLVHRFFAIRELSLLLKIQASMALFATPTVRARSGYDRARRAARPVALPVVDSPAEVSIERKRAVS